MFFFKRSNLFLHDSVTDRHDTYLISTRELELNNSKASLKIRRKTSCILLTFLICLIFRNCNCNAFTEKFKYSRTAD